MLITAGGMRIDNIITQQGQIRLGELGGNALYSAAGAALWEEKVWVWARIGHNYPKEWLPDLQQHGLILEGLVNVSGSQAHQTFYAYGKDGKRHDTQPDIHFSRIGLRLPDQLKGYVNSTPGQDDPDQYEPLALRPSDWPSNWESAEAVHLAPMPIRTHLNVSSFLHDRGVRWLTIDPGERYMIPRFIPDIRRILPKISAFLPSREELLSLFGTDISIRQAAEILCQWGVPTVIVKLGADGVLVYREKEASAQTFKPYHQSGDARIVDVTGAGDSFCGGFLAGLFQGKDIKISVKMGLIAASVIIEGYGVQFALNQPNSIGAERLRQI